MQVFGRINASVRDNTRVRERVRDNTRARVYIFLVILNGTFFLRLYLGWDWEYYQAGYYNNNYELIRLC